MSIEDRSKELVQIFSQLPSWEEKYKRMIEMGRNLSPMEEALKTEENQVKGCQSQVWLWAKLSSDGKIQLIGDSDALIVKGLIAILISVYSESSPEEILKNPPHFIADLGFKENLSPSRTNGLSAMIKQIRNYAIAFDHILRSKP